MVGRGLFGGARGDEGQQRDAMAARRIEGAAARHGPFQSWRTRRPPGPAPWIRLVFQYTSPPL